MTRSMLPYLKEEPKQAPAQAIVVALHGGYASMDQMFPLARKLSERCLLYIPESPRPYDYNQASPTPENQMGRSRIWYLAHEAEVVDPVTFGDNLAQLELFLREMIDQARGNVPPLFLLGFDQGAVLALTLASIWPDALAGVIGICGFLPEIPDAFEAFPQGADGLAALLIYSEGDEALPDAAVQRTARCFREAGAEVTLETDPRARELCAGLGERIAAWLAPLMAP